MRLAAHPLLIHCLVSVVFICVIQPDASYDFLLNAWTGHIVKHGAEHPMHGLAATGGNVTLKSNDKAPRYETNNPASSCTNKLIGDSCALCVSNAHL